MKVCIIGAGINGLYLGKKLSEIGCRVVIFEKNQKAGNKVCSGLFSERIFDFLPETKKMVENIIEKVFIHFPKKTIELQFSKKFYVINHSAIDEKEAKIVKKLGVKINFGKKIYDIPSGFDKVIGCDGASSIIRKQIGLPPLSFRLGILGFLPKKDNSNYVETWPCEEGFIWKVPRGDKIEYGIISSHNRAVPIFNNFLKKRKISLSSLGSRIIPIPRVGSFLPPSNNVTICGDALGLTKPWSGGGVVWGLVAANFLLESFPDFLKYRSRVKKFFIPRIVFSKIAVKMVYKIGFSIPHILPNKTKIESDFLL